MTTVTWPQVGHVTAHGTWHEGLEATMQPVAEMLPSSSPRRQPPCRPHTQPPSPPSSESQHPATLPSRTAWSSPPSLTGPSAFSGSERGKDKQNVGILHLTAHMTLGGIGYGRKTNGMSYETPKLSEELGNIPEGFQSRAPAPAHPARTAARTSGPVLDVRPAVSSETPPSIRVSHNHL